MNAEARYIYKLSRLYKVLLDVVFSALHTKNNIRGSLNHMNKIKKTKSIFQRAMVLFFISLISTVSLAKEKEFIPEWTAIGKASFNNGIKLPMYGISVENPMDAGVLNDFSDCHKVSTACAYSFSIPDAQKDHLQLVEIPETGAALVPREWHEVDAAVGVDGSTSYVFYSQKDRKNLSTSKLAYYNAGACVGCAYSAAAQYFDNAIRQAKEEFFYAEPRPKGLHLIKVNAKKVIFSRAVSATMEINGVAYFDPDSDEPYSVTTVTLPKTERALASTLLNFSARK